MLKNLSREEVLQVISTMIQHNTLSVTDLKETQKGLHDRIVRESAIDLSSDDDEEEEETPEKQNKVLLWPSELNMMHDLWCGDNEELHDNTRFHDFSYGLDRLPKEFQQVNLLGNDYDIPEKKITCSGIDPEYRNLSELLITEEHVGSVEYVMEHMQQNHFAESCEKCAMNILKKIRSPFHNSAKL